MESIPFGDRESEPAHDQLQATLGATAPLWDEIRARIARDHDPVVEEWIFPGMKWGWALRLKRKKRAVVYLTPCDGYFVAGTALGEKAIDAARDAGYPDELLDLIDAAPRYPEGSAVRIEVRSMDDVDSVERVAAVKMAN